MTHAESTKETATKAPFAYRVECGCRLDLLDPDFLLAMAHIMAVGAKKYGEKNWQKPGLDGEHGGVNHALKHLMEYQAGVPNDYGPEELHMAQVAVNAMFEHFHCKRKRAEKKIVENMPL